MQKNDIYDDLTSVAPSVFIDSYIHYGFAVCSKKQNTNQWKCNWHVGFTGKYSTDGPSFVILAFAKHGTMRNAPIDLVRGNFMSLQL